MGAKSTNITSQQMLPLFQVISDLEKPYESSLSLATNVSTYYLNNKAILDNDDIIVHHYSKSDNISSKDLVHKRSIEASYMQKSGDLPLNYGKYLDAGNTRKKYTTKHRRKYRKRLKKEHRDMDEIRFQFNGRHVSEKHKTSRSRKEKSLHHKKSSPLKYGEAATNTDNSSPIYDNKSLKKRIGLFTEMELNAYKEDDVDISRHFKNISKDDLLNSETEHGTTCLEQSDPIYEVPKNIRKVNKKKSQINIESDNIKSDTTPIRGKVSKVVYNKKNVSSKKIIQKYEEMLTALMERNQNKDFAIQEKDGYINKMKSKLKELLFVNNQFADENDYMKKQYDDMKACIEQYKALVNSLEHRVEKKDQEIELCKGKCINCNDNEVLAMKAEKQGVQLSEDLLMLKNVVYRLNVQLSRYQDKLRSIKHPSKVENKTVADKKNITDPVDKVTMTPNLAIIEEIEDVSIPPLPNFERDNKDGDFDGVSVQDKKSHFIKQNTYSIEDEPQTAWGDVNTHTLAPLLNAYQESIVEKDQLIRDYECEFNRFTTKLKYLVDENNAIHEAMAKIVNELSIFREKCGLATTERDTLRRDCDKLKEQTEILTNKLTEVHSVYEQKVDTMSRDYTLIHEEYFKSKSNLASAHARCQVLEEQCAGLKDQDVVPSTVHINRIEECRRLFEELKTRYENDKERLNTRINLLQQNTEVAEKKIIEVTSEKQKLESKYKYCEHLVRKHRRETQVLKTEIQNTKTAKDIARRRAEQATNFCKQMAIELHKFKQINQAQKFKTENLKETFKKLDSVEDMLKDKDKEIEKMKEENEQEVSRLKDILRENMATIEAMRQHISQTRVKRYGSLQRLDVSVPDNIGNVKLSTGKNTDMHRPKSTTNLPSANLMPVKGGYFLHKDKRKATA